MDKTFVVGKICQEGEIIISEALATNIFDHDFKDAEDLKDQTIKITYGDATKEFTISGVYEDTSDYSAYACVYINKADLEELYEGDNKTYKTTILYVYVTDTSYISAVQDSIEIMGYATARDDSSVETILGYVDLGTKVLTGFSLISIVVSAIMIFIVTYISVIERTKEIGVLRAVGGRRKDVTGLFILESGMIGAIAGTIAVVFSLFISIVANLIMNGTVNGNLIEINVVTYLVCFVMSIVIGVGAGLMPSLQASNLDPIEALRCE